MNKDLLYYLASPYSKYPEGIDAAFEDVCAVAGRLMQAGFQIFSPIAHMHPIGVCSRIPLLDHAFWFPLDITFMKRCDGLIVAMMDSWERSYGIAEERKFFEAAGKPCYFLDVETMEISSA